MMLLATAMVAAASAAWAADSRSLPELLQCMRASIGNEPGSYHSRLETFDASGKHLQRIEASVAFSPADEQGRRDIRVLAVAPDSLAGTAYLVRRRQAEPDVFLYLPSQQRTLRLSSAQPAEAFGSDLDLNLLNQALLALRQGSVTAGASRDHQDALRTLYLSPAAGSGSTSFDMAVLGVNPESCLPETITLEQRLAPISRIEMPAEAWRSLDGKQRYPGLVRIEQPDNGSYSTVTLEAVTPLARPPKRWFRPDSFMAQP